MKKHDLLFSVFVVFAAMLLLAAITENVIAVRKAHKPAAVMATGTPPQALEKATAAPAATESARKKFETVGLPLHDGKYWKEIQ